MFAICGLVIIHRILNDESDGWENATKLLALSDGYLGIDQ